MNRSGKMKVLLRSLLLSSLCTLSSWSVSSDRLVVTQSPDVSFQEGETGNISCCWKGEGQRVRIQWFKNQTLIQNKTGINISTVSQTEQVDHCSVLPFPKFTTKDSGKYICRVIVEIPTLTVVEGNGTTIRVTTEENSTKSTPEANQSNKLLPLPVIIPVAVLVPLFLIALVCFCSLRRKEGQAVRVIYEVPHTDSIDSETDIHSTNSSKGSIQWCDVATYDSLDYFERVETKKSG